jgi:hypothetical protein
MILRWESFAIDLTFWKSNELLAILFGRYVVEKKSPCQGKRGRIVNNSLGAFKFRFGELLEVNARS